MFHVKHTSWGHADDCFTWNDFFGEPSTDQSSSTVCLRPIALLWSRTHSTPDLLAIRTCCRAEFKATNCGKTRRVSKVCPHVANRYDRHSSRADDRQATNKRPSSEQTKARTLLLARAEKSRHCWQRVGHGCPSVDESLRDSRNWQFRRNCPTGYSGRIGRVERTTFGTWFGSPVGACLG